MVEVVAVVLERALAPLLGCHLGGEALDPALRQLGEGHVRRCEQLAPLGLGAQEVAPAAGFAELGTDRLEAGLARDEEVDAVGAVLLAVDAALDSLTFHPGAPSVCCSSRQH